MRSLPPQTKYPGYGSATVGGHFETLPMCLKKILMQTYNTFYQLAALRPMILPEKTDNNFDFADDFSSLH